MSQPFWIYRELGLSRSRWSSPSASPRSSELVHECRSRASITATGHVADSSTRDVGVSRVAEAEDIAADPIVETAPTTCSFLRPSIEQAMMAVLATDPFGGECVSAEYRRKERELGTIFATLTMIEAHTLHGRLSNPMVDDPFATRFGRLVAERKSRLLAFLGDARRREAMQYAGREMGQ